MCRPIRVWTTYLLTVSSLRKFRTKAKLSVQYPPCRDVFCVWTTYLLTESSLRKFRTKAK